MKEPDREALLAEYGEAMASQRANTQLVYSWTGNIIIILASGLVVYGVGIKELPIFLLIAAFALMLMGLWLGMTETFVFYIGQRMKRIAEIEKELGMKLMSAAGDEIRSMGFKARFVEARSYVRAFGFFYCLFWVAMGLTKFYF